MIHLTGEYQEQSRLWKHLQIGRLHDSLGMKNDAIRGVNNLDTSNTNTFMAASELNPKLSNMAD